METLTLALAAEADMEKLPMSNRVSSPLRKRRPTLLLLKDMILLLLLAKGTRVNNKRDQNIQPKH
ncbi:hypothetical protein KSX_57270 [Ktedonospora formicarum]|uniref:Uncharacterized protein n=1 Tax=Ktedonospora formicarum TaxID=2778364 RepID=A0A8J3I1F4_9CHLR|nr:hypothetical protein KSX_57270 [Ktedonospora formicarum]